MSTALLHHHDIELAAPAIDVDIAIPVYNEAAGLEASVRRLYDYLTDRFPLRWQITIVDNASVDGTWPIALRLTHELPGVRAIHLDLKGRGRALRTAWSDSTARVVAYMDVDLSTDLDALLPLVAPLLSGHSEVAIGSRLAPAAHTVRGPKRELISRSYNLILRGALHSRFSDAQCGFKAMRADVAQVLLPHVHDNAWFFDTELLAIAEHNGLRIHEVPVDWVDDPDSRVDIKTTAIEDLKGVWRMRREFARGDAAIEVPGGAAQRPAPALAGQLVRFASVGLASTVAFAVLVAALEPGLGIAAAAVLALLVCSIANLVANDRFTFGGARARRGLVMVAAALPFAATVTALVALASSGAHSLGAQLGALTLANLAAGALRFLLLRRAQGR